MSTIKDDDKFLVQRGNNSHQTNASDLMSTIRDTDLMLVQRGTDSYKVTGEDVKDSLAPANQAPDIAAVTLTEVNPDGSGRFTNNEFPYVTTMGVVGEPAPTYAAKARVFGATYDVNVKSDVITEVEDKTEPGFWTLNKVVYRPVDPSAGGSGKGSMYCLKIDDLVINNPAWASLCTQTGTDSSSYPSSNFLNGSCESPTWQAGSTASPQPTYTIDFTSLPLEKGQK